MCWKVMFSKIITEFAYTKFPKYVKCFFKLYISPNKNACPLHWIFLYFSAHYAIAGWVFFLYWCVKFCMSRYFLCGYDHYGPPGIDKESCKPRLRIWCHKILIICDMMRISPLLSYWLIFCAPKTNPPQICYGPEILKVMIHHCECG